MKIAPQLLTAIILLSGAVAAQHEHHPDQNTNAVRRDVESQPLLAHALRVREALQFAGSPLPKLADEALQQLQGGTIDASTVAKIQSILDPFCIALVDINPESRVKVEQGVARPLLMQEGWTTFLVKVNNQAHITAAMKAESPNAAPVLHGSTSSPRVKPELVLTDGQLENRFLELDFYLGRPMHSQLSGLGLEYMILQVFTRATGKREARIGFNVGQGTQDIGFRNTIDVLFDIRPAVKVIFRVKDIDQTPTTASFIVTDRIDRFANADEGTTWPKSYRNARAISRHWQERNPTKDDSALPIENRLDGIYPLPSRRVASRDPFPDFFFQPQVYRADGEYLYLPPGKYYITYGRGPEYKELRKEIEVREGISEMEVTFQLERWIHLAKLGWYSADHHIHAAGCSHYESPEEGVKPVDMWRQIKGEDLNLGSNLTWGPSWYHQKEYFTGKDHPLSDAKNILRYDVEVSGFPSSHAGHIVLLNLKEDDYPNTTVIEDWPSWTLPVLKWAHNQGGVTGYAHSGWGLEPLTPTNDLPNYVIPKMDNIGANEYIVTVTHDAIDFFSAGDTPAPWELNMWYHTLNAGYRTRISGETDFPCISDERIGAGRIYAKLDGALDFGTYMEAIKRGRSYVSDGYSHLIDFSVNGLEAGQKNSELLLKTGTNLKISVKAAAYLNQQQDAVGKIIASRKLWESPYWHIERSRIGTSRRVPVELIVNGVPVEKREMEAQGNWNDLTFSYKIEKSSWVAVRIFPSVHTNPVFVVVDGKPIRERKSIEWCRASVDQCWKMKKEAIRIEEHPAAKAAYDHARLMYDNLLKE